MEETPTVETNEPKLSAKEQEIIRQAEKKASRVNKQNEDNVTAFMSKVNDDEQRKEELKKMFPVGRFTSVFADLIDNTKRSVHALDKYTVLLWRRGFNKDTGTLEHKPYVEYLEKREYQDQHLLIQKQGLDIHVIYPPVK